MRIGIVPAAAAAACACVVARLPAQDVHNPQALIEKAEKARKEGDALGALRAYTDAIGAARGSGASESSLAPYLAERDRLLLDLLGQFAEVHRKQAETVQLLRGIAQQMAQVSLVDKDVQERVKRNEDRLKDIEQTLLDVTK